MTARKVILDGPLDGQPPDEVLRTARFHALIQEGLDELDRGEGIEVTDVKAWLDSLGPQPA
jgi:predicted transcriptional regulator